MKDFFELYQPLFDKSADAGEGDPTGDGTGADDSENAGKDKKVEFTPEQQAFIDKKIGEARVKEREKAKAEAETKVKAEQEAADKKVLEEKGEFKKLAEAEQKKAQEAEDRANKAVAEAARLKLQRQFDVTVTELGVKFVNSKAAEDAFAHLDTEAVGEDFKGMEGAVKKLIEDRDYFFEEVPIIGKNIDATSKGKINKTAAKKTIIENKRKSYQPL